MRAGGFRVRALLALALSLAALGLISAWAAPATEEWVVLRIHQAGGDITVQSPRAFVTALSQDPTGVTLPVGHFKGRSVRMSADRVVRLLRDAPADGKEALLFTRQTDQGPAAFYARTVRRAAPSRGGMPLLLAFDMTRKGAAPVHLTLPLAGSATLGKTLLAASGFQPDSDVSPLLERGLECARKIGTGPFLRASAADADISVALR